MIIPTIAVEVHRLAGHDRYGQPRHIKVADAKFAPVRLAFSAQHTTVRTDSAASHGHASENTADVVILMLPVIDVKHGDMLVLLGRKVRVTEIHPRFTVRGKHDHNQIHCEAWV